MGASRSLSRWRTIFRRISGSGTAAAARSPAPVFSGPISCRSTWLAPPETTRWMRSISGCEASRPSTCRGSSMPDAPETRRARRWAIPGHPTPAIPSDDVPPLQREVERIHVPAPLHGQQHAAAVEAAQDLAAESLGGVSPLAVGAQDDVARLEPPAIARGAVRHLADRQTASRLIHGEPDVPLQDLQAQPLGRTDAAQAHSQR